MTTVALISRSFGQQKRIRNRSRTLICRLMIDDRGRGYEAAKMNERGDTSSGEGLRERAASPGEESVSTTSKPLLESSLPSISPGAALLACSLPLSVGTYIGYRRALSSPSLSQASTETSEAAKWGACRRSLSQWSFRGQRRPPGAAA